MEKDKIIPEKVQTTRMANNNGNGKNGGLLQIAQLASTGVLILGMFGMWWQTADPRTRLDKIETTQVDNRRELNEKISSLQKEISTNFVSLREHNDLTQRLKIQADHLSEKDLTLMPKIQFDTWKTERDLYLSTIQKRIDDTIKHIESLERTVEKLRETGATNISIELLNKRIDQLYNLYREVLSKMTQLHGTSGYIPPSNGHNK